MNKKNSNVLFSTNLPELTNFMFLFPVETSENFQIIKSLNNSTAKGIDGINNIFLELLSTALSEYLSVFFLNCVFFFKLRILFRFISLVKNQGNVISVQYLF